MRAVPFLTVLALVVSVALPLAAQDAKLNVALVTGGHKYDEPAFEAMWKGLPGVTFARLHHEGTAEWLDDISNWNYDVIVLYNMSRQITEQQRANFVALLEKGVGLVVLHHAMVAYQEWPEYQEIAGCKYFQKEEEYAGKTWPKSTFQHDVQQKITVVDPTHPITQGLEDFEILDETYGGMWFAEDNHLLLRTDAASSNGPIAYTRSYAGARICTIELGHDAKAYANPSFQRLLTQAMRWTAKK